MFYYAKICFICLEPKEMLKEICPSNEESDTYKHITFVLPELVLSDVGKTARVCTSCQFTLESYHTFKKMCLENYCQWTNYVAQAKTDQEKEFSRKRKHCETQSETIHETIIHEPIIEPIPIENVFIKTEPDLIIDEMEVEDTETESEVKNEVSEVPSSEDSSSFKNVESKKEDRHRSSNVKTLGTKLQEKSKQKYEWTYLRFMEWRSENQIEDFTEADMLAYFHKLLTDRLKSSTVWSVFSILRTTLLMKHNIDIGKYVKLYEGLKEQSKGYEPVKSAVFTPEQMRDFINRAPNDKYLLIKVSLIFGVTGALFRDDLKKLTIHNIQDNNNLLIVQVRDTRFVITGQYYNICKRYLYLRARVNSNEQSFFLNYQKGRCVKQVVGINKFSGMPRQIAMFLKLPDPKSYTGKCFRRTAATVGLDQKGNFVRMKRRWKKVLQGNCETTQNENENETETIEIESEDEIIPDNSDDIDTLSLPLPLPFENINNVEVPGSGDDDTTPFEFCSITEQIPEISMNATNIKQEVIQKPSTTSLFADNWVPPDLPQIPPIPPNADSVSWNKLSEKTKQKYTTQYTRFMDWRKEKNINTFTEADVLGYFHKLLADNRKYTTLFTNYSMLRTTLQLYHNVDIGQYRSIYFFLKEQSKGYKPVTSEVFTADQLLHFINHAPDDKYLLVKVAAILGVVGAMGRFELRELRISDIKDAHHSLIVKVRDENFTISGNNYIICRKYLDLRPETTETSFFLNYQKGKCTKQPVGINKFSSFPRQIATLLRLPDPKLYTGKCFRSTAASVGLDSHGNFVRMQRRWKKVLQRSNQSDDEAESEEESQSAPFCPTDIVPAQFYATTSTPPQFFVSLGGTKF